MIFPKSDDQTEAGVPGPRGSGESLGSRQRRAGGEQVLGHEGLGRPRSHPGRYPEKDRRVKGVQGEEE